MFRTALLSLDLSPAAQPLLDCMPELMRWGMHHLVIVHIIPVGYVQGPGYRQVENTTDQLEADAAPLRAAGLQVTVQVRTAGVPAEELLATADEVAADLVIVGSRSRNVVSRLFLGSVARAVLQQSRRPVLLEWVEPTSDATAAHCQAVCSDTLRAPLLATDLSKHAAQAERAAVALAPQAGCFQVLTVLSPQAIDATPALPLMARAALADLVTRIEAAGGHGQVLEAIGDPVATIQRVATERNVSLIVVGRHGQGRVLGSGLGRTAARLCESAGRPVLLVPLPD